MKEEIINHINHPKELEKLYRVNKTSFKQAFVLVYPELKGHPIVESWNARLNYEREQVKWGTAKDLIIIVSASLLAGLIAKLPVLFSINEDFFYPRNIGFIVLPILTAYFAFSNKLANGKLILMGALILLGLVFINLLPDVKQSDTLILSCIHLVLFLWAILGFAYVGDGRNDFGRLSFLKYNGDLVVITTLILISGGLLSAITVGLFELIGIKIEAYYFQYVGIFGLAAAPIVGTYLTQTNPQLVGRVSPVIAKLFSPLVVVMLIVYLAAIVHAGKSPYHNREFLLIFNALLLGVLALIFFSVAETTRSGQNRFQLCVLLALSVLTIIVNSVALSAIIFRIAEWGFTPNRTVVLGGNILILIHLLLVSWSLFHVVFKRRALGTVGQAISSYLPIYVMWAIIVTFIFPFLFHFK